MSSEAKIVAVGGHLPSEGLRQLHSQEAAGNVVKEHRKRQRDGMATGSAGGAWAL